MANDSIFSRDSASVAGGWQGWTSRGDLLKVSVMERVPRRRDLAGTYRPGGGLRERLRVTEVGGHEGVLDDAGGRDGRRGRWVEIR